MRTAVTRRLSFSTRSGPPQQLKLPPNYFVVETLGDRKPRPAATAYATWSAGLIMYGSKDDTWEPTSALPKQLRNRTMHVIRAQQGKR